jgi:hypothetical protein
MSSSEASYDIIPDSVVAFTDEELLAGVPGLDDAQQQAPETFEVTPPTNIRLVPVMVNGVAIKMRVDAWMPKRGAGQWGLLLETMGTNLTEEDAQSMLGAFCDGKPLSVLSTRFK